MYGRAQLMHKNDPVCDIKIDRLGEVEEIYEVFNESLLPPSISLDKDRDLKIELTRWLSSRIPKGRLDLLEITAMLSQRNFKDAGKISLIDTYWFKTNKDETWENTNAFDNWDAQTDPICLLNLKPEYFKKTEKIVSPILALPGKQQRIFLRHNNGDLYIISPNVIKEMSFYKKNRDNESVAKRKYVIISGKLFSAKKLETSKDKEMFPLSELIVKTNGFTKKTYQSIINCFEYYGLSREKYLKFMKNMYSADENIGDDSRDLDSIYLVRDANTLKFEDFAKL